ncbi:MAG: hypothetical protein JNM27_11015 [Leptospirales bacterium]|nr:hypothetical protein [Leptospirales bacterium]
MIDEQAADETSKEEIRKKENPLRIGVCTLDELEEKVKAFRVMNQTALKKRFILCREEVATSTGEIVVNKRSEIDISKAKLMRRHFQGDKVLKTFQPDEGIVIISDMSNPEGIPLSMDLVTQVMNLGGGTYEGFIDRVDSFADFLNLLKKALFPRLVIVGYLPSDRIDMETMNFARARKVDQYVRVIELTHTVFKPKPYFSKVKHIHIDTADARTWGRFIIEIVREYTKPYFVEEF